MADFLDVLVELLKRDSRFFTEDGMLLRNKVYESAMNMDGGLVELLLLNPETKERFFVEVNDMFVFDKVGFGWVVNNRQFMPDSYTRFKNRIGLTDRRGDLISASNDVALSFPYKDCILEGGQTKDDQKRDEIFYNVTLAPEEVDRLLYPKVLAAVRRYTVSGVEEGVTFGDSDNLIIKGNNLLALASLLKRYEGKVKLIYWDIPYNTGSDSFGYNDKFKRSTFLTFIKNRTDIAKKLLAPDGVLIMQCSFHQYAYLNVLLDEIFTEKCHKLTFNILVRHPERILTGDKEFNDVIEYALVYSKNPDYEMPKIVNHKADDEYIYAVQELASGKEVEFDGRRAIMFAPNEYSVSKLENGSFKTHSIRGSLREKNSSGRFYVKYLEPLKDDYPAETLFKVDNIGDDGRGYRYFQLPRSGNKNGVYFQGKPTSSDVTRRPYPNYLDFVQEYNAVNNEGGVSLRNGKKPEKLLEFLISLFAPHKGDIVLDSFAGSGTTAAVAHKMGRRYIGVEQMDYIETILVERLKNVINGEEGGISHSHNWQGGGSFIYCELAKCNQQFVDKALEAKSDTELAGLLEQVLQAGYISRKVNPAEIAENAADFATLSLEDKKRFILELLDKNMLYVNLCDLDDEEYAISEADKAFTRSFYGLEDE